MPEPDVPRPSCVVELRENAVLVELALDLQGAVVVALMLHLRKVRAFLRDRVQSVVRNGLHAEEALREIPRPVQLQIDTRHPRTALVRERAIGILRAAA